MVVVRLAHVCCTLRWMGCAVELHHQKGVGSSAYFSAVWPCCIRVIKTRGIRPSLSRGFSHSMAIPLFVRHLYQRYKEHKVSYQQTDVLPASQSSQPIVSDFPELHTAATTTVAENRCLENSGRQNITSNWRWRLTLMAGLFIPIFLETLDYTGEYSNYCVSTMTRIDQLFI